jgi:hypothetical protein
MSTAPNNFVIQRKLAYEEAGFSQRWTMRGIGYLYTYHHLILAAATDLVIEDNQAVSTGALGHCQQCYDGLYHL